MKNAWSLLILLLTSIVLILLVVPPSGASNENQVAVVVDFGNGQIGTKCVGFAEESISGFEALQRSGLPVETDFQTGGAAVCRIDGKGCPSDDCFCECRGGGECKYWSYWHFANGAWNYSVAGSSIYQVRDGAVDGWVWGLGSITQASPPPTIPFNEICTAGIAASPTVTLTPVSTSTPLILPTLAPTESGPSPTLAASIATATMAADFTPIPTLPTTESDNVTPTPVAAVTQTPTGVMGESADPVLPATTTPQEFAAYPSQSGGEGSDFPLLIPTELAPDQALTVEIESIEAHTPVALVDRAADGDPLSGAPPGATKTSTATAVVVSAVVGVGAPLDQPFSVSSATQAETTPYGKSIAGFLGLLIMLCALALLVYRQRKAITSEGSDES